MSTLSGKRVVVTRAAHQSDEFAERLRERGAIPLFYPCIDIAPTDNPAALREAAQAAAKGEFDWLVLTSANTVSTLKQCLKDLNIEPDTLKKLKLAVVGTATAAAAETQLDLHATFLPDKYTSAALGVALKVKTGTRILLPQSGLADAKLAAILAERGARVTTVEAYRTVAGSGGVNLAALLKAGEVDAITFTSPSTVTNLLLRLKAEGGDAHALARLCLAYIGPKTAEAARKNQLPVLMMPPTHTLEGLISALEDYFAQSMENIHDGDGSRRSNAGTGQGG